MNTIKKYIAGSVMAGVLFGAVSVFAATSINLSPATVNVKAGQTFSVPVFVDPQGVKNYTVELKLNFPADLLQVTSFNFDSHWMPLNQPGYELIDNQNGLMIKTAGYPQGFTSNVQFGTVTFKASKTGTGAITLATGTAALNQTNQNLFSGSSQVNVSVAALIAQATPIRTPRPTQVAGQPTQSPIVSNLTAVVLPPASSSASTQQASIFQTVWNKADLGTNNMWVALLVVLALAYLVFRLVKLALKR